MKPSVKSHRPNMRSGTALAALVMAALAAMTPLGHAADLLDHWTWRNPLPTGDSLAAVAHANGTFVVAGHNGTIFSSTDGTHWKLRASGTEDFLSGATFGHGRFVAVSGSAIYASTNGVDWTSHASGTEATLNGVAYGNGRFVAVGGAATIVTSTNGTDWSSAGTLPGFALALAITFANDLFVAVGLQGRIATSPDGLNWTPRTSGTSLPLAGVTFGNGLFVAVGSSGPGESVLLTSPNGIQWTPRSSGTTATLLAVTYDNDRFVAVGVGVIRWSTNAINWSAASVPASIPSTLRLRGVGAGNGLFVAVGEAGTFLTSPDGKTWTDRGAGERTGGNLAEVAHDSGLFVAVGGGDTNAAIVTSPDGFVWTRRDPGVPVTMLYGLCHGQDQFVAVGSSGRILTSPDGVQWRSRPSGTTLDLHHVAFGGGTFVACGANGAFTQRTILTSTNGSNWTVRLTESGPPFEACAYGDGQFVMVGGNGTIRTSTNGIQWTPRTSGTTETLSGIAYGNGRFVAMEAFSTHALMSTNGIHWSSWGGETLLGAYSITFGNGVFVAGGVGFIYTSLDGTAWTRRSYGTVIEAFGLASGAGQFLMVGTSGAILGCDIRPRLGPLTRFPTGAVELPLEGVSGLSYAIEASANLGDWTPFTTLEATNGTGTVTDPSATNATNRFYRAVWLP